jgi:hypothetical protein
MDKMVSVHRALQGLYRLYRLYQLQLHRLMICPHFSVAA